MVTLVGGALASLCALDLHFSGIKLETEVMTLGCPRIGNQVLANYFKVRFFFEGEY
jgi:hypothetical protein